MLSYYSSMIDAMHSRTALENVMKNNIQMVSISSGRVCDIVLKAAG